MAGGLHMVDWHLPPLTYKCGRLSRRPHEPRIQLCRRWRALCLCCCLKVGLKLGFMMEGGGGVLRGFTAADCHLMAFTYKWWQPLSTFPAHRRKCECGIDVCRHN